MKRIAAYIFHPPFGDSEIERLVEAGRLAGIRDLVQILRDVGLKPTLLTPARSDGSFPLSDLGLSLFETGGIESFDFGASLRNVIRQTRPHGFLYFGSGSGVLLSRDQVEGLRNFAAGDRGGAVFNNFYSCDFAAVSDATALLDIALPRTDNPLGLALADAGVPCFALERSAETQFDLDTPIDLMILRESVRGGRSVRTLLEERDLSHPFLSRILEFLTDRSALVYLLGRVSPRTWADIEDHIACRTGGAIEGRGMQSGVCSHLPVLQHVLRNDGPRAFFRSLADACDGALIDTRPLLADSVSSSTGTRTHRFILPEAAVRFASDLLRPEAVSDPNWRSFTQAACEATIPVVLGGHSIVSGGLYLLADACWKGRDLDRRLHPQPFDPKKERS